MDTDQNQAKPEGELFCNALNLDLRLSVKSLADQFSSPLLKLLDFRHWAHFTTADPAAIIRFLSTKIPEDASNT